MYAVESSFFATAAPLFDITQAAGKSYKLLHENFVNWTLTTYFVSNFRIHCTTGYYQKVPR